MKSLKSLIGVTLMFGALAMLLGQVGDAHAALHAGIPMIGLAGAVVNTKSDLVSNLDRMVSAGLPNLLNPIVTFGGKIREQSAQLAIAAADNANSVYRFGRVRSSARISSISLLCQANGSGGALDIGLYETAANGGGVANATAANQHLFSTSVSIASAVTEPTEVGFANLNPNQLEQQVWQLLGLASDPDKDYDVAATLDTNGGTAANVAMKLRYVEPNE